MISYGDMLDTIEINEPQETTVTEKKGGDNEPKKKENESQNKCGDNELENGEQEDEPEDVI